MLKRPGYLATSALSDCSSLLSDNKVLAEQIRNQRPLADELATAQAVHELLFSPPTGLEPKESIGFAHSLCVI